MERTLSLPVLRDSLGPSEPGVLPSPEVLMNMIADAEIRALASRAEVSDSLLQTAWYLHGVCALTEAAELYTPARQRHAFAVSAHIFDLALADSGRSGAEMLSLAFGAQIGYRRADQDPNASAVYRRVASLLHAPDLFSQPDASDITDYIHTLALEAGVAFLGFPSRLHALLRFWQSELRGLAQRSGGESLQGTMYGSAQAVVNAVADLTDFLVNGSPARLERARTRLQQVLDGTAGSGDLDAKWIAAHLLDLHGHLVTGSLHRILPPETPAAVAQAFTLTSPPVLTLWPPQRALLSRAAANPLDPATGKLLVSVPTSAGKSLISQLIMCTHLATVPGRVVYVSPLRSLAREMRRALRGRLRILDREMGVDAPDFPVSWLFSNPFNDAQRDPDIEVMTPERLMHALRNDPDDLLQDVTLIVIDEAHHIAQGKRGLLLEGLLAYCQTHPSAPRLVLLSAAIGNGAAIAQWLDPDHPELLFASDWRGPRRLHGLLTTSPRWDEKATKKRQSKQFPWTTTVPMDVDLAVRLAQTSEIVHMKVTDDDDGPLGEMVLAQNHDTGQTKRAGGTAAYKMFASAATVLLPAGSMLVVAESKVAAQRTAAALADHLADRSEAAILADQFAHQLGAEHPLVPCVRRGVAFHHAGLPTDVQEAIEEALRKDELLAVVSTTTLTDGVNLPVRTVVITAALDGDGQARSGVTGLDTARLLNAVGRAGRAGRESEGWILLALNRAVGPSDHDIFTPNLEDLQVNSALTTPQALDALVEAEQLIAASVDGILEVASTLAGDFLTYVWFVLDAHDRLDAASTDPLRAVDRLLAMQQLPTELRDRWTRVALEARSLWGRTAPSSRRRWASAGTSLSSAQRLEALARRVERRVVREYPFQAGITEPEDLEYPDVLSVAETLRVLDEEDAFEVLLSLPEREAAWWFYDKRAGKDRQPVAVDLREAISAWIGGEPIPELARRWLPSAPIDWALEQAVTNVSTAFEHYLSWTLGALINMVNNMLAETWEHVRLRPETAWFLRYGVNTEQAVHLLTSGIHSRTLAHGIGTAAASVGVPVGGVRSWLADQHLPTWHRDYGPTPLETDDLIEYVRQRRRSLIGRLLREGRVAVTVEGGPDERVLLWPAGVTLDMPEGDPAQPIGVMTHDGERIARISASDHADVAMIIRSGLAEMCSLDQTKLTIWRQTQEN